MRVEVSWRERVYKGDRDVESESMRERVEKRKRVLYERERES